MSVTNEDSPSKLMVRSLLSTLIESLALLLLTIASRCKNSHKLTILGAFPSLKRRWLWKKSKLRRKKKWKKIKKAEKTTKGEDLRAKVIQKDPVRAEVRVWVKTVSQNQNHHIRGNKDAITKNLIKNAKKKPENEIEDGKNQAKGKTLWSSSSSHDKWVKNLNRYNRPTKTASLKSLRTCENVCKENMRTSWEGLSKSWTNSRSIWNRLVETRSKRLKMLIDAISMTKTKKWQICRLWSINYKTNLKRSRVIEVSWASKSRNHKVKLINMRRLLANLRRNFTPKTPSLRFKTSN